MFAPSSPTASSVLKSLIDQLVLSIKFTVTVVGGVGTGKAAKSMSGAVPLAVLVKVVPGVTSSLKKPQFFKKNLFPLAPPEKSTLSPAAAVASAVNLAASNF